MRAVSVFAFQVIDFLVYLFVVFDQLTRRRLITISYLLVMSESAKSAAQVFRVLVQLRAHAVQRHSHGTREVLPAARDAAPRRSSRAVGFCIACSTSTRSQDRSEICIIERHSEGTLGG
jgi:hypothetical protein